MVQRREMVSKYGLDSKKQEEKKIKKISLVNGMNPGDAGLVAGRPHC